LSCVPGFINLLKDSSSMSLVRIAFLAVVFTFPNLSFGGINPGPDFTMKVPSGGALAGQKPRIFITADPLEFERPNEFDDLQSFIETMLLSDVLDIEGIAVTSTRPLLRIIDAYERDLPNLQTYSPNYPSANYLRSVTVNDGDDGVNLLIQAALKNSDRPLYVLSWGLPHTLADALKVHPEIASKIRIIMIGDSNISVGWEPRESFSYLYNLRHKLWWVLMDNSFRGAHVASIGVRASDPVEENFSKYEFPAAHAKDHGALGNLFYYGINWSEVTIEPDNRPHFRSGDLPSLLYLLRGNPDTPDSEHWGGRFEKVSAEHGSRYGGGSEKFWVDVIDQKESIWPHSIENPWKENIQHDAQRTVIKYHMQFMPEIAARYDRAKYPKGANPQPLDPLKYTYASGASADDAPVNEPAPQPQPVTQPTPEPTQATPEPVTQPTPEPTQATPEPVTQSTPEPTQATPEPVTQATPEPATQATPEPVTQSSPEPVTQQTLVPVRQPNPSPEVDINSVEVPTIETSQDDVEEDPGSELEAYIKWRCL